MEQQESPPRALLLLLLLVSVILLHALLFLPCRPFGLDLCTLFSMHVCDVHRCYFLPLFAIVTLVLLP
jgi:hypothetical protein